MGIVFAHSPGYKLLRVVQREGERCARAARHKAKHTSLCSVIQELQIECAQRDNQHQPTSKASPSKRFQRSFSQDPLSPAVIVAI